MDNIFKNIKYLSAELEGAFPINQIRNIKEQNKTFNKRDLSVKVVSEKALKNHKEICSLNNNICNNVCSNCPKGNMICSFNSDFYCCSDSHPHYPECNNICKECKYMEWVCGSCFLECETCLFLKKSCFSYLINQEVQISKTTSWDEFQHLIKQHYPSKVNETCGGHIHIQFNDIKSHFLIANLKFSLYFENLCYEFIQTKTFKSFNKKNKNLYTKRFSNKFCFLTVSNDVIEDQLKQTNTKDSCRNYAVNNCYNLCTHNTTEFRFFPMLSDPQSYLNMIEWFLIEINEWIDKKKKINKKNFWYNKKHLKGMRVKFEEDYIELYFYKNIHSLRFQNCKPQSVIILKNLIPLKKIKELFNNFINS